MKNKKFTAMLLTLALCVSVMFGCATTPETPDNGGGGTNNPETPAPVYSAETLLNTLRGDIALSGKWSYKKTGEDDQQSDVKTFIASGEYFVEQSFNGQTLNTQHYFKNAAGKLVTKTVDSHNVVKETVQTTGGTNEYDRVLKNPFTFVETSMMTKDGSVVTVDASAAAGASTVGNVIYSMLVNSIADVESVTVTLDDSFKPVSIKVVTKKNSDDEVFTYNGTFTTKAALDVPVYPYPAEGDKTLLTNALNKLKAGNYTYTVYSSAVNEGQTPTMIGKVTSDGVFSTTYNKENKVTIAFGFIDEPTGGYLTEVEAAKDESDNDIIKGTANFWKDMTFAEDKLPSADFSVDLFKAVDGGYKLRSGNYSLNELLPHAMCSDLMGLQADSLVFKLADDLSEITYTYNATALIGGGVYTVKVVLSDLGTTSFPYDLDTQYVPYDPSASKWSEVAADGNGVTGFNEMFPDGNIDEDIPFYTTETGQFTFFGAFGGKFEIDITYESEDDASWDLDYGYIDMFSGITTQGWTDITPDQPEEGVKGVYTKGGYKLTVKGEAEFFGTGYVVYIYIEPYTAQ